MTTPSQWPSETLTGPDALWAATDLFLAIRADDPMAGVWEAGDVQWWWKDEPSLTASDWAFWRAPDGTVAACLSAATNPDTSDGPGKVEADIAWRPAYAGAVLHHVLPEAIARLVALADGGRTLTIIVREDEPELRERLEAAGFRRDTTDDSIQTVQRPDRPPDARPLPEGFRFADDRERPAGRPHHLAKRNGARVTTLLRETSLYRPDLDLCIRSPADDVAAYCLCWLDEANGVGLFEPVRTEDAYQRRGLGQALLAEGIRRMMAGGATLIKVTHMAGNPAAQRLYESVGFVPAFRKLAYAHPGTASLGGTG
ncbi:MAG: GNAT family N-acetyltransferase [Chloroflexota bacterium]|nr:GNAT family N-acetyltransferase [Chloroflexota bacterium]MDQ3513005.1 GNAT family N-acetyltransferase [Chloroflexota bacterium]